MRKQKRGLRKTNKAVFWPQIFTDETQICIRRIGINIRSYQLLAARSSRLLHSQRIRASRNNGQRRCSTNDCLPAKQLLTAAERLEIKDKKIRDKTTRARFGNIHAFNNVIIDPQYATISVMGAVTLVENSLYRDATCATSFSHAKDYAAKEKGGTVWIVDSLNENPRASKPVEKADERFEQENNFKSNVERAKLQFNLPRGFEWSDRNRLPYEDSLTPTAQIEGEVRKNAGARLLR
jgi:hypothetical protein